MTSTTAQLENDLRTLAGEAGRSLPAVKEAAQIGLNKLAAARAEYASIAAKVAQGEPVQGRLEDVFRPFLLACNHRNANIKLVVVALGSIQRLLHADALGPEERLHVMHVLRIQAQREGRAYKDIEVKILQTLPLLIMSSVHPVHEDLLLETVGLCCAIYDQDPGLASAALTQILTSVFERVEQAAKEDPTMLSPLQSRNLAQNSVSAMHLLQELTQIIERGAAGGSLPTRSPSMASYASSTSSGSATAGSSSGRLSPFFRSSTSGRASAGTASGPSHEMRVAEAVGSGSDTAAARDHHHHHQGQQHHHNQQFGAPSAIRRMPRSLALELLETILSNHASLFLLDDEAGPYAGFVRTRICPVLERAFGGRCDWQLMVRMLRTVVVLLCELRTVIPAQDVKTLFRILLDMLDDDPGASGSAKPRYVTPLWHRVLTLETLNILLSRQDLLGELQQIIMPVAGDMLKPSSGAGIPASAAASSSAFAMAAMREAAADDSQAGARGGAHSEPPRSVFISVVDALCKLVSVVVKDPNVAEGIDAIAARPTKGLDLLSEEAPPSNLSVSLVTLLAAECLASIADGMALSKCILGTDGDPSKVSSVVHIGKVNSRRTDRTSSPPLLAKKSSALFLAGADDESLASGSPPVRVDTPESGKLCSSTTDSLDASGQTREDAMRRDTVREMMVICWEPMLRALALLLQSCNNENVVQFILKAYMSMTNTCGIVDLVQARNAFILSLCNFSLPNWHSSAAIIPQQMTSPTRSGTELEPKHLQALKALFNIAHGLGSILGTAWHIVLETFEQLDHIMFCVAIEKKLTTSGTVHVTGMGPSSGDGRRGGGAAGPAAGSTLSNESEWHLVDDEMAIVESMLRFLFNSTKYLDEDALIHIQTALTQLSFTVLAHTETMRMAAPSAPPRTPPHLSSSSPSSLAHRHAQSRTPPPKHSESEGWISSTVMNFTSSLADAASATLTSVIDDEDDLELSDDDQDMPDLGIDLTLEQHAQHPHALAHQARDGNGGSSPQRALVSTHSSSSSSGSSSTYAPKPTVAGPDAGGGHERRVSAASVPARTSTPPTASSVMSGADAGVFDGVIARATYRNPPFAIEKLVETTKLNMFRIGLLWEMTQNVLSTVASKSDPKLRLYGVHAMEDLVTSALLFEVVTGPADAPGSAFGPGAAPGAAPGNRIANKRSSDLLAPVAPEAPLAPARETEPSGEASVPRPIKSIGRKGSDGAAAAPNSYPPPSSLQVELIEGFSHLLRSHHSDAREATIQAMSRIIGTCGHVLDDGWRILIVELSRVTGTVHAKDRAENFSVAEYKPKDVEKLVPIAFKAVQLIVDDFLPGLSLQHKKELALCICAFGRQEPHVNISLTSITMLWTMCDHVQRSCSELASAQKAGDTSAELAECNTLLLFCMEQLAILGLDQRPEVRSCAVRTLCSIIVACSQKLTMDSWRMCTLGIVFPLLDEVIARGSQASSDQVHGEVLGRLSNKRAQVHHSLDTLEKQWRETIVTAIQGAARVVRACVQYSGGTTWSLKSWEIMLRTIRSVMSSRPSAKVGVACARSLQELGALVTGSSKARYAAVGMQVINGALVRADSNSPPQMSATSTTAADAGKAKGPSKSASSGSLVLPEGTPVRELWAHVWNVYEDVTAPLGGDASLEADSKAEPLASGVTHSNEGLVGVATMEVATEIVSGIGDLYSNNTGSGMLRSGEVMSAALNLVRRLLDAFAARSKHLTGLERAVLRMVESFPPLQDAMWPIIFNVLRAFVRGDVDGHDYSTGFAEKSRDLFISLFEHHAPSAARALVFEDTVREVLSLASGDDDEGADDTDGVAAADGPAWDLATLQPIVKYGLRSLSTCGWLASRVEDVWINLLDMLHALMLGRAQDRSPLAARRLDVSTRDALALLDTVMEEARPLVLASCVPSGVQSQFFNLLQSGCTLQGTRGGVGDSAASAAGGQGEVDRLHIGRVCLDHLLTLSSFSSSGSAELSELVLATLLHGVEQVVVTFFEEAWEQREPEERARREADALTILEKLRDMEIHEVPPMYLERFDRGTLERCGRKAHLLLLLPILNRFVLVDNAAVRQVMYEILEIVSTRLVSDRD